MGMAFMVRAGTGATRALPLIKRKDAFAESHRSPTPQRRNEWLLQAPT